MQPLPGFRDFLPNDCATRNYIFERWREVARRYGFVEWDGPVLEPTALYTKKSGPEIVGQLFNFTDKGEREVAMRPELTPSLARVVAAHDREFKKPLKWFSIPQCFRYEKQQRGRLREHFQFNADIIGEESLDTDVELIALCIDVLRSFGLTSDDFIIRLSSRRAWADFLTRRDISAEQLPPLLEVVDKIERADISVTTAKLDVLGLSVNEVLDFARNPMVEDVALAKIVDSLNLRRLQNYVLLDLTIVRGLAYYTGIVFEAFDRRGKLRAIAGGGRYDNLIHHLSEGAVSLSAIGFAMGDVVLSELIKEVPAASEQMQIAITAQGGLDVYVIIAKEKHRAFAVMETQSLRNAGWRVDYPLTPAKVGKQFQTAEQRGARLAILFGDEWPDVRLKDLRSGEQTLVAQRELAAKLATLL